MAFDLEEQEQLEALKAFWAKWGKLISGLVTLILVVVLGWQGYGWYQSSQSAAAAKVLDVYNLAIEKKDGSEAASLTQLQKDYPTSRYAALATFNTATIAATNKEWDKAATALQWLVANSTPDNQSAARIQLADVLVESNKIDDALKALDTLPQSEFAAAFANKKSDVLIAKNDIAGARAALEEAIKLTEAQGTSAKVLNDSLKRKLDFLPK